MQVYLREAPSIAEKGELRLAMENVRMSPVDQRDVAKVAFALLTSSEHEGKIYEMTGPEALTMHEIAQRISGAIGREVVYIPVTPAERREDLRRAGLPVDFIEALDEQGEERRRCSESRVFLATHEGFGVQPTTFAEFAHRYASVFRWEASRHKRHLRWRRLLLVRQLNRISIPRRDFLRDHTTSPASRRQPVMRERRRCRLERSRPVASALTRMMLFLGRAKKVFT
jgi:hypothetical protein